MYCQDSAVNYIRDADILVSDDLENWTKVVTIGDGNENTNDAGVKCIDSEGENCDRRSACATRKKEKGLRLW